METEYQADILLAAVIAAGLLTIILVIWLIARHARFRCRYCNHVVTPYFQLEPATKRVISSYFEVHEKRIPDTGGIYLCTECRLVYDDFSGDRASREQNPYYGNNTFCKVCHALMMYCDPENKNIKCPKCHTQYTWFTDPSTHYRFLKPESGVGLSEKAPNYLDSLY